MILAELPKSYTPAEAEGQIQSKWEAANAFHADPSDAGKPYCIVIPPPNVTAPLHLGHALNNTLQDCLIRYHRMCGFNTLWMPGTDHAGIATQTVVEKRLLQQGKKRTDFTRDEFIAKVQAWKDQYEVTIIEQLKSMGCSCDWERQRFTMDEICARSVREAFFRLFKDGLIYRGKRLVNWDPVTLTALADDEVETQEVAGHMWYLKYPLAPPESLAPSAPPASAGGGGGVTHITVATTRPETMLGDTAIAMNPNDPRAAELVGKYVRLPIVDRDIEIIADDYVVLPTSLGGAADDPKAEFATGFLKVTPAHDPNDWDIGQRHDLEVINVLAPDASISIDHGWEDCSDEAKQFVGLSREDARKAVVDWFKKNDLLEDVRDYSHSVGHSYRSHVPIEPYLSDQWYVGVSEDRLCGEALRAQCDGQFEGKKPEREAASGTPLAASRNGDNELNFFPARYAKTYQVWHENLRDWCISRQLWWGHRIPVWSAVLREVGVVDDVHGNIGDFESRLTTWVSEGRISIVHREAPETVEKQEDLDQPEYHKWQICVRNEEDNEVVAELEHWGYIQDPDVLDTWFSSALWPISTMGWPEPKQYPETQGLLEAFNPSSVLCTGRDIITLWVSRMVMFNRYFREGTLPFRDVHIHPMIQDGHGQRMSKSLGNGVDPRDIVHTHGADAMRYVLLQMATTTQDVRLVVDMICPHCDHAFHPEETRSSNGYRVATPQPKCPKCSKKMVSNFGAASGLATPTEEQPLARITSTKFDLGRNFANKLWNATRFAMGQLDSDISAEVKLSEMSIVDRWIIARLHNTLRKVETAISEYQFNIYADCMYDFIWGEFCGWYLEAIKPTIKDCPAQQQVLRTVLNAILRLLHPICPFVTETLWPHLQATGDAGFAGITLPPSEILTNAAWPTIDDTIVDEQATIEFEKVQELIDLIRNIRGEHNVAPKKRITLFATQNTIQLIEKAQAPVEALAGLASIKPIANASDDTIKFTFAGEEQALADVIEEQDKGAERDRLQKFIADLTKSKAGLAGRLSNPGYRDKAPAHLVDETKAQLADIEADLEAAQRALGDT